MENFDVGHQETRLDLPDPLAGNGWWNLGTWALPHTTLSVASTAVFGLVLAFLLADAERRALFVLPFPAAAVAVPVALLAAAVAFGCRNRPGRPGPRYWALALAGATAAIAALSFFEPSFISRPLLHALAIAGGAAVLTLLPRLARVRPDSSWVQRIVLLTLAGVLGAILPSSCYVARTVIDHHHQQVHRQIFRLEGWAQEVRAATDYDWPSMRERPETSAGPVERLQELSFAGALDDPELWRAATALGREAALARAAWDLIDEVVAGLDPERTPKLSRLVEPAARWDPVARRWLPNARFPAASAITGDYHRQLGRLFLELEVDDPPPESLPMVELEAYSRRKRTELCGHLTSLAKTWADHWAVYQIPEHERCVEARLPLVDLLRVSLIADRGRELAAADVRRLMGLRLADARELGRHAPGCRTPEYPEGSYDYFRFDCYAYAPRRDGPGAGLRVELRVVFRSRPGSMLENATPPTEIYYLFPVPEGTDGETFQDVVMTDLHTAIAEQWAGTLRAIDRSGLPIGGFRLLDGAREIFVHRPREIDFLEGRKAIEVRAERRS